MPHETESGDEARESVVTYATVRESSETEWLDIECRFANGEKFVAVQVVADHPELAARIAAFLSAPEVTP